MFFKRLLENRIALLAMLLTAIIFGYFGYLLATDLLTFELAKDGAFFVWACVMLLTLLLEKGGGRPSTLRRDMEDRKHGAPGGCAHGHYLPPARSHRAFASTFGGHAARFVGNLKRLVGHGIGGQPRLQVARVTA